MPGSVPACLLVRHAHAEWPAYRGRDFDRPLTERGLADAHATGQAISAAGLAPRRIVASAARRTEQTARVLMEQLQLSSTALQLLDSLYNADAPTLQAALQPELHDGVLVLLVAHNPGISELARQLAVNPALRSFRPAEWRAFGVSSAGDPPRHR
jgi:phosphohistidine phosphatase